MAEDALDKHHLQVVLEIVDRRSFHGLKINDQKYGENTRTPGEAWLVRVDEILCMKM